MNRPKILSATMLLLLLLSTIILGSAYVRSQQRVHDFQNQISLLRKTENPSVFNQNEETDPPNGQADTKAWLVAKDPKNRFTLRYPSDWVNAASGNDIVLPKGLAGVQNGGEITRSPLSLTVSSNVTPSPSWRQIVLADGERAYYSFADGFDSYAMINGTEMLIWTIPARSYNGLYTDQVLREATQIINTYQSI